jgi:hypothetical protein
LLFEAASERLWRLLVVGVGDVKKREKKAQHQ